MKISLKILKSIEGVQGHNLLYLNYSTPDTDPQNERTIASLPNFEGIFIERLL